MLGAVVNHVKGARTRRIRTVDPGFAWQARFYDVVIRKEAHLDVTRRYTAENPRRAQGL